MVVVVGGGSGDGDHGGDCDNNSDCSSGVIVVEVIMTILMRTLMNGADDSGG